MAHVLADISLCDLSTRKATSVLRAVPAGISGRRAFPNGELPSWILETLLEIMRAEIHNYLK
jgi:hypothetical protein